MGVPFHNQYLGTVYTPSALPSEWCEQHGHTAYGMAARRWADAQVQHEWQVKRWESRRRLSAIQAPLNTTQSGDGNR